MAFLSVDVCSRTDVSASARFFLILPIILPRMGQHVCLVYRPTSCRSFLPEMLGARPFTTSLAPEDFYNRELSLLLKGLPGVLEWQRPDAKAPPSPAELRSRQLRSTPM